MLKLTLDYFKTLQDGDKKIVAEAILMVMVRELDKRGLYEAIFV